MTWNELFATLVAKAGFDTINDILWLKGAGVSDMEELWDEFEKQFKATFGIELNQVKKYM